MAIRSDRLDSLNNNPNPWKGSPLPPEVRVIMEARFGRDFSGVQLHTDDLADASARALGAKAYTVGSHIVFAKGRYNPSKREGLWLLAHELAHVVQQRGEYIAPRAAADTNLLEATADRAADLIASGRLLPPDFALGTAPFGLIQCHDGPPCGGWSSIVDATSILLAERMLELAFIGRVGAPVVDVVMCRSNNYQWPANVGLGGKQYDFAIELLDRIRQLPMEERPNVLSFSSGAAYFFWRFPAPDRVVGIINRFHAIESGIARKYNLQSWDSIYANWFPNHALPFPVDPLERFVCTAMTNHQPPRGLILYDIRQVRKPRRAQRRAMSYELHTADVDMAEFFPSLKAELPNAIQYYDPDNSNFVFIVPADFYYNYYNQKKNNAIWESYKIGPSYDFPGGQAVKELRSRLHHLSNLIAVVGVAVIAVGTVLVFSAAAAAAGAGAAASTGVGAGAGATATGTAVGAGAGATATGTAVGAGAAMSLPPVSTIVAPAAMVAKLTAAGTAAAAGGGATAALWAVAAAPAAKATVALAGVLLLIGTVKNAHAGTGLPDRPFATHVSAFRAVPVADFKPLGATQAASSLGPPLDFSHTPETAKGQFNVGTKVLFDNVPHIIIGGFSVS